VKFKCVQKSEKIHPHEMELHENSKETFLDSQVELSHGELKVLRWFESLNWGLNIFQIGSFQTIENLLKNNILMGLHWKNKNVLEELNGCLMG
jgi:hypothetical protein